MTLLPSAAAVVNRVQKIGPKTIVDAPYGVGIPWHGQALVDGKPWAALSDSILWLPAGTHSIEPGTKGQSTRLVDFNGTLEGVETTGVHKLEITYRSPGHAVAMLDRKSTHVDIDGAPFPVTSIEAPGGYVLLLPRGQHIVTVQTE